MPSLIAGGREVNNTRVEEACNKVHSICLLYNTTRRRCAQGQDSAILPPHLPPSLSTLAIICRKVLGNFRFCRDHQFQFDSCWTNLCNTTPRIALFVGPPVGDKISVCFSRIIYIIYALSSICASYSHASRIKEHRYMYHRYMHVSVSRVKDLDQG